MELDPSLLVALGDVLLNLSAGWFAAAVIVPGTFPRGRQLDMLHVVANILFGTTALALGYQLRILGT